jgi:NAD(P)-dependent dehydrogenase (short-subunit alcohol dehydrogenase family)
MALPSPVKVWHSSSYDAINPAKPSLSVKGKTVLITGGGRGLGNRMAYSFALAGAAVVGITGRTETSLEKTKAEVEQAFPDTKVITAAADVTDQPALDAAFKKIAAPHGGIDIVVANAGYFPYGEDLEDLEGEKLKDWWKGFESKSLKNSQEHR